FMSSKLIIESLPVMTLHCRYFVLRRRALAPSRMPRHLATLGAHYSQGERRCLAKDERLSLAPGRGEGEQTAGGGWNRVAGAGSVDGGPDLALDAVEQSGEHDQEQDRFHPDHVALLQLRFGRPGQEIGHVARHLVDRRLGAVSIGDRAV